MSEKEKNITQKCKVQAYTTPKIRSQIEDYRVKNGMTTSEAVTDIVRKYLNHSPYNPPSGKNHY